MPNAFIMLKNEKKSYNVMKETGHNSQILLLEYGSSPDEAGNCNPPNFSECSYVFWKEGLI